mmetsp:Transcript_21/g.41  ORF Transcript_21/g.41 Transcript_21/m.41 type:complete len:387 (-) Transcript_21:89-1249(-)|eukprot:CAMPEP_0201488914 /NCGR_PEP_ID=MMETSP0151_2-20130828/20261_1 /ASSEMBLY_ACC=CAM_ASM_000257 /TAXON_ID=200890 /ORGANISM="Paramoeba atlantica, Strain 621/1 / CCAP 1560/9" /LENGTH=386 /DNA_ID=CAMNT_0047874331 /DNA_START=21 /DNA_END=1181 /DNA_ORIENTATION=-
MRIVVVGGGNAAHCFVGMLRRQQKRAITSLHLFTALPHEEKAWAESGSLSMVLPDGKRFEGFHLDGVVPIANPGPLLKAADLLLFCVPSFAIEPVLDSLKPHLHDQALLVSMPGNGGFMRCARSHLSPRKVIVAGTQQLPIQCRLTDYAKSCRLIGTKHGIQFGAMDTSSGKTVDDEQFQKIRSLLEDLFDPIHFYPLHGDSDGLDVYPSNQCIHIPRLYGLWKNQPFSRNPLFYEEYPQEDIEHMDQLCDELRVVSERLGCTVPCMKEVMIRYYHHSIKDQSTLQTCFTTNEGYAGLLSPMVEEAEGKWVLDLKSRYFIEDIPYSLLVGKSIAQRLKIDTPVIDNILRWAEKLLDTRYFVDEQSPFLDPKAPAVQASLAKYHLSE